MFLFDENRLDQVSDFASLRGHDFSKVQCVKTGHGIDDMTNEEKFEASKHGIGGSTVPNIMGVGFDGANGMVREYDKRVADKPEEIPADKKRLFAQGHYKEDDFFEMFEETLPSGWTLKKDKDRYTNVDFSWMYGDFDGILVSPWGEEFIVEIKSYKWNPNITKPTGGVYGMGGTLVHDSYKWQVYYYMYMKNVRGAVVIQGAMDAMSPSELVTTVIYRDFVSEEKMLEACKEFWYDYYEPRIRPTPNVITSEALKYAKENILQVPKKDKVYEVNGDPEFLTLVKEYVEAKEEEMDKKAEYEGAKQVRNSAELEILKHMKDCDTAATGDYYVKRKIIKGKITLDTKKLKSEFPDIYDNFKKEGNPSESLEVVERKVA